MKLVVVGTGYVGLVTAASFAENGYSVFCLDIDQDKVEKLKLGIIPFFEPGLKEVVLRNSSRLKFSTSYKEALLEADIVFLALPTPSNEDGSCNTSYIESAIKEIAKHVTKSLILVGKSTVPVGTSFKLKKLFQESLLHKIDFEFVSNPEFLKEGTALQDSMKPDRIIIGAASPFAFDTMRKLYSPFNFNHDKIIEMDILSAELTKYAANAMLASRISFMNEIGEICKKVGANINEVRKGIGSDSRIGHSFLYAGIGYGGSCFPKDIKALIATAKNLGCDSEILEAIDHVNQKQRARMIHSILSYFNKKGGIKGKTIAIWGLSFKPDTDDMREAPSLTVIDYLLNEGAHVKLFDPIAMESAKKILNNHKHSSRIKWCENEFEAAHEAHGITLLTEWKQFRLVNFKEILKKMKGKVLFDGRNQYKPHEIKTQGLDYIGVGVPDHLHD